MLARYRRFERRMGWEEQPLILAVVGWAMIVQGVLMFSVGLAVVLTH